jgi:hypothetical protein
LGLGFLEIPRILSSSNTKPQDGKSFEEKHFEVLFNNSNGTKVDKASAERGADILKFSWKQTYYENCKKSFSAKDLLAKDKLLKRISQPQRQTFEWLCKNYSFLATRTDEQKNASVSDCCSTQLFCDFIHKCLSLLKMEDQLSHRTLKGLMMANSILLLPNHDRTWNAETLATVEALCRNEEPETRFERVCRQLWLGTKSFLDSKPPQILGFIGIMTGAFSLKKCFLDTYNESKSKPSEKEGLQNKVKDTSINLCESRNTDPLFASGPDAPTSNAESYGTRRGNE